MQQIDIEHFSLTPQQLDSLIGEALGQGGQWADLYFEDSRWFDLLMRDSQVSSGGMHSDFGCGIRVLCGEKTGYAYAESTDYASLLDAARCAGSIASQGSGRSLDFSLGKAPIKGVEVPQKKGYYPMEKSWDECPAAFLSSFLTRLDGRIRSLDARVVKVVASLSYSTSKVVMYNSLGELTSDFRPLGSVSVQTIFIQGGQSRSSSVSQSFRCGAEMISDSLLESLASRAVKDIDRMFEARRPKGGTMSVVMKAGASGILLHEAMGHAFEADFNRKEQSVFSSMMGKRVCREGINIVDDATLPGRRGSLNYDDEGVPGQKTYMVTDGVLTSYLHDRISAAFYGVAPTGNGRRESFRYNPIPRMRATYMENGSGGASLDDLIAQVDKGVYVEEFSNGEVKIGEGDFTFYVRSGYLIENGRLTMPIKDVNVIGNGPRALSDIREVASDLIVDNSTWTCGKEQSAAVSCGMPSVLIDNLTIGGEYAE